MSKSRLRSRTEDTASALGALLLIASIAAAFAPATALAQQPGAGGRDSGNGTEARSAGWYSGLSLGRPQADTRDSVLSVTEGTASSLLKNESSTSYKLYGYRVNRNFALEGGYTDFGKLDARRDIAAPVFGSISSDIRSSGLHLDAVGIVPLQNGFSLFGKLGTIYTTSNASISTGGAAAPPLTLTDLNLKRSEWNSRYSLGASYSLSNNLGLRFEYERINNAGDLRTGEGNFGMWSLGFTKHY